MQKYATVLVIVRAPGKRKRGAEAICAMLQRRCGCSAPPAAGRVDAGTLLEEGSHRLASVVGERTRRHGVDGALVCRVHVELERVVEDLLAERFRGAAAATRDEGEALRLLVELLAGHDAVHQAPGE